MRNAILFLFFLVLTAAHQQLSAQINTDYETRGDVAMAAGNFQQAADSYTLAIKAKGHEKDILVQLYNKRGACYAQLKQFEKAMADFTKVIALNPQFGDAYWAMANIYESTGLHQLAIMDYKKVIPFIKTNEGLAAVYTNIAQNDLAMLNYNDALTADSMAIIFGSQNSRVYEIMGRIHAGQHKADSAVNDYNRALISLKNSNTNDMKEVSFVYTIKGDAEQDLKKYKDAINDYSFAIEFNGANGFAWWNRAAAYHSNGDYGLAANDYTRAMTYYQGDSINLSKLYDDRASNELAQSVLPKAIEDDSIAISLNPDNNNAYYTRANAYTQNGDYQQGIDYFKKFMVFFKGNKKLQAFLYYQVANNEYFLNEFDKVVADCTEAVKLDPAYQEPYYYRGKVYLKKMGKENLAMIDFNKVIALDTTKKSVGYVFSLFYTGKGDQAAAILQNDLLSTNDSPQLLADYYNLACLYSLMNKPDEANIYLKKAFDNGYAKKYAIADEDLDNIRNTADYKAAIAGAAN